MTREEALLLWVGHGDDWSIKPCGCLTHSYSNFTWKLLMMRGETLLILVLESKLKVNFCTMCIKFCRHNADYSLIPITILICLVAYDKRRDPTEYG